MKILKPTLTKIIFCLAVLAIVYYVINSTLMISYVCKAGGDECVRETAQIRQGLVLKDTLMTGLPIAIIGYIIIGLVQSKRKDER